MLVLKNLSKTNFQGCFTVQLSMFFAVRICFLLSATSNSLSHLSMLVNKFFETFRLPQKAFKTKEPEEFFELFILFKQLIADLAKYIRCIYSCQYINQHFFTFFQTEKHTCIISSKVHFTNPLKTPRTKCKFLTLSRFHCTTGNSHLAAPKGIRCFSSEFFPIP